MEFPSNNVRQSRPIHSTALPHPQLRQTNIAVDGLRWLQNTPPTTRNRNFLTGWNGGGGFGDCISFYFYIGAKVFLPLLFALTYCPYFLPLLFTLTFYPCGFSSIILTSFFVKSYNLYTSLSISFFTQINGYYIFLIALLNTVFILII